ERPCDLPLIEDPASVTDGPAFEARLAAARKELEDHITADFVRLTEVFRQRLGDYLVRAATTEPDLTETTQFGLSLTPEDFRPALMLRTRRLIAARATPTDPVFGLWAQRMASEEAGPADLAPPAGVTWNPKVVAALRDAGVTNRASVARAYGDLLRSVYERSRSEGGGASGALDAADRELLALVTGPESPVAFPRRETPDHMSRPEKDRYGSLVMALDKLAAHATNRPPARAMVVRDLPEPVAPRVFLRGNPSRPGPETPRGFLRVLQGGQAVPFGAGSGRRDLAEAIVAPSNPLTARVFVNRVWMHHFGEPLVASPADFGARSEPPADPALLDWLASEFMASGWRVKSLHRMLVLSAAYAQAVRTPRPGDPEPAPWVPTRRRLDLESMRDSLLWISGRLDATVGGLPGDAASDAWNARRTVYGLVDRQNLPSLFRSFDFAAPDQCVERRPRTLVPQQALFALNSPFVLEQARALAALPTVAGETDPARRVRALFGRVLGRDPSPSETTDTLRWVAELPPVSEDAPGPWELLAQSLMISNDAVFLD
ncbi:MAG: DUF1553 domain-containing protein, partial [Verrucomicrobia bacterium]|nr:DUF1553 domain-containing protein [Verrucomicrobiota bacterium]